MPAATHDNEVDPIFFQSSFPSSLVVRWKLITPLCSLIIVIRHGKRQPQPSRLMNSSLYVIKNKAFWKIMNIHNPCNHCAMHFECSLEASSACSLPCLVFLCNFSNLCHNHSKILRLFSNKHDGQRGVKPN